MKKLRLFKWKKSRLFYVYFILMLLLYFVYASLDIYRFNPNRALLNGHLTQEDITKFSKLANWTSGLEIMFIALFLLVMMICCFKREFKVVKDFLLINITLFTVIAISSYILFLITPSPMGNLLEPLILPIYLIGALLIYMLWLFKKQNNLKNIST